MDVLDRPARRHETKELEDTPQPGDVVPSKDNKGRAPRNEDWEAEQAALNVILVDAGLVEPDMRLPAIMFLELSGP